MVTFALVVGCGVYLDAGQGATVNAERRRDAIARMWRDAKPAPAPLLPAEVAWTLTLPVVPSAPGAMDQDRVYIPLRQDLLVALARETGLVQWTRTIDTADPVVVGHATLFAVSRGRILALDAETGADLWSVAVEGTITAPLVWDSGWLIAIAEPGEVLAFRAADGLLIWRRALGAPSPHPAVPGGDNALYVTLTDGRVVALGLERGETLWEQTLAGTLSEPAAARDRVFVGSTDNFFYALDADSGSVTWKWRNGGDVIGAAADGDVVYLASLDNVIRAVNRGNGNQRWLKSTVTRPVLPPRAFGGIVVLPGLMPAFTVFVGDTGAVMGSHATGNLLGAPLLDTSLKPFEVSIVTITREGIVEALRPAGMMFREAATVPLTAVPGRRLSRERMAPAPDAGARSSESAAR
jgi:outer membrane protein assembly factor BamB